MGAGERVLQVSNEKKEGGERQDGVGIGGGEVSEPGQAAGSKCGCFRLVGLHEPPHREEHNEEQGDLHERLRREVGRELVVGAYEGRR